MSRFVAIQEAVFQRLRDSSELSSRLASFRDSSGDNLPGPAIYDHVPQPSDGADNSWFPYITVGDDSTEMWDTDTSRGMDTEITIHVWSRKRGRSQCKEIQSVVYDLLHEHALEVDGQDTVLCHHVFADTSQDPDGKTRHGVQRFRLVTDNV